MISAEAHLSLIFRLSIYSVPVTGLGNSRIPKELAETGLIAVTGLSVKERELLVTVAGDAHTALLVSRQRTFFPVAAGV